MLVAPYPYSLTHTYIGAIAQEHRLNLISNNMANVNTPGFKKEVPVFRGFMVQASKTDHSQAGFRETENLLDMALSGPGFFQVQTPDGIRYTRNGSFTKNAEGEIVTSQGFPLVGAGVVPENTGNIVIDEDGRITAVSAEDGLEQVIGQIEIVEFEDPNVLAKEGNDMYTIVTEGVVPNPAEETTVSQGYLEMANVDPVMESVNMIDTLRTYEVFQKIIISVQEMDQKCISEVGRLV